MPENLDLSPLFAPLEIRGKKLRNRIVMPPMVQLRPITTPEAVDWYARRAAGGVGLIIVEATSVNRFGTELKADNLRPLVAAVQGEGARIAIQLFPITFGEKKSPEELSEDDIAGMIRNYIRAAGICAEAGFDAMEPHGAHGYVLNQFFSPEQNARTDD